MLLVEEIQLFSLAIRLLDELLRHLVRMSTGAYAGDARLRHPEAKVGNESKEA